MKFTRDEAIAFLESPYGILLHELGHHASANARDQVAGHIVIQRSLENPRGAFIISEDLLPRAPSGEQIAFALAAGALAELEFAGLTNSSRLKSDIAAFTLLTARTTYEFGPAGLIGLWIEMFGSDFSKLLDDIAANYATCIAVMKSGAYRLHGHDVMPTHLLSSKGRHDRSAFDCEIVATEPRTARLRALDRYISAQHDR